MKIKTKRFTVKNETLKNIINFYWQIDTNEDTVINHNLLPMNTTDLIFNFSTPIKYIIDGETISSPNFHFSSIKNQSYTILQNGKINVFGISLLPHGLYCILQKPISLYSGKIIDIQDLNIELTKCIQEVDFCSISEDEKISCIETTILKDINFEIIDNWTMKLLNNFYSFCYDMKINDFCLENEISIKQFERICLRILGVTPKQFQCLNRYRNATNSIIYNKHQDNFAELANNLNYFDQTHFNKEFRKYSGYSPMTFKTSKPSIKQNSEFI